MSSIDLTYSLWTYNLRVGSVHVKWTPINTKWHLANIYATCGADWVSLKRKWRIALPSHVTYLSGVERGVRNPSLKNIRAIANALDVRVGELFAFDP